MIPPAKRPEARSAIVWALVDEGFTRADAEAWADGCCHHDPGPIVVQAIAYDDHGIPLHEAIDWHQHGFYPAEAICFYDSHYTPQQAATLVNLAHEQDIDDWVATDLPADRVIAYLKAGVTLAEVPAFEAADTTDATLDFLTALRD